MKIKKIKFKHSFDDFLALQLLCYSKLKTSWIIILMPFIVAVSLSYTYSQSFLSIEGVIAGIISSLLVLVPHYFSIKKLAEQATEIELIFSEDKIVGKQNNITSEFPWNSIKEYKMTPQRIILALLNKNMYLLIPKSALKREKEWEELQEFLKSKIATSPHSPNQ